MKTNELRLNNYVLETEQVVLLSTNYDLFKCLVNVDREIGYKPIPLTEEWLLNFGFEKENSLYVINKDKYHTFSILLGDISFPFIKSNDKVIRENFSFYGIKYVHQLQNLYFALTKKELTFKSE